ncbi:hypothetical protein J5N97_008097 [Dioscorea zingiberensis]|uniref:MLO-like protein n=1 Tax=Dioscorea zingiberensis TaxID=325984 RepID=A0A9D5DD34_9LILI|nr:hypothetical protein J5N97_008097 [Dioscorea zingiberensis]
MADDSSSSSASETLEFTPTWVVASVCFIIVLISLCVERIIHYLGKFFKHNKQIALYEALQKLKEELMLLGFISLLLTVFQSLISNICIEPSAASSMLPCDPTKEENNHSTNYFLGQKWNGRRLLSEGGGSEMCTKQGKAQLLSLEALHQLHIFIFVLAVVHVVFCATTMLLGGAKIRQWKHWEDAIHREYETQETPSTQNQRHHHHFQEFVKERAEGSWVMSFFKQFYSSVSNSDYRALRSGFIKTHRRSQATFDFHKYMLRALEDDFKKVVGISWYLWLFVVIFLLLNIKGWHTYFWLSFLPLFLLLLVGAKLEHIITRLAQQLAEKPPHHEGSPVKLSDEHFWFNRPWIVLYLIHFILFQNAFEIAVFFWIWSAYGFHSCIIEGVEYLIPRLVMGLIIQVLCSYSTLPLYAIVTQMGDSYKAAIFEKPLQSTLYGWAESAKERKRSEAFSSFLRKIGLKSQKPETSGGDVQMHRMELEACERSHEAWQPNALDEIAIEHLPNAEIQPQQHIINSQKT